MSLWVTVCGQCMGHNVCVWVTVCVTVWVTMCVWVTVTVGTADARELRYGRESDLHLQDHSDVTAY